MEKGLKVAARRDRIGDGDLTHGKAQRALRLGFGVAGWEGREYAAMAVCEGLYISRPRR